MNITCFFKVHLFSFITDDAKEKVDLTEKRNNLSDEGKTDAEIEKAVGKPKFDDLAIKRAKKIIKKLNKETESVS